MSRCQGVGPEFPLFFLLGLLLMVWAFCLLPILSWSNVRECSVQQQILSTLQWAAGTFSGSGGCWWIQPRVLCLQFSGCICCFIQLFAQILQLGRALHMIHHCAPFMLLSGPSPCQRAPQAVLLQPTLSSPFRLHAGDSSIYTCSIMLLGWAGSSRPEAVGQCPVAAGKA